MLAKRLALVFLSFAFLTFVPSSGATTTSQSSKRVTVSAPTTHSRPKFRATGNSAGRAMGIQNIITHNIMTHVVEPRIPTTPPTSAAPAGSKQSLSGGGDTSPTAKVPATSIYLGAWVDPDSATGRSATEIQQIPAFNQSVGRALGMYNVYTSFSNPPTTTALATIASYGAIPLVSWACTNLNSIVSGAEDSHIQAYANALKAFGRPVLLRFYWEMNNAYASFNSACGGYGNPTLYVAAWQHVWNAFRADGATNVAFVWNPSVTPDASAYYPGNSYVDWIGADGYDRSNLGTSAFPTLINAFYSEWAPHNKPILVGETGAMTASQQQQYIAGMEADLPTMYPDIKAIIYWDAVGASGDNWVLQGSGLAAFASMAADPYFQG